MHGHPDLFSDVLSVSPLAHFINPAKELEWDLKYMQFFQAVKAALCRSPFLAAPNFSAHFKLEFDASGTGAEAVLI